jgi:hypothetical protein
VPIKAQVLLLLLILGIPIYLPEDGKRLNLPLLEICATPYIP